MVSSRELPCWLSRRGEPWRDQAPPSVISAPRSGRRLMARVACCAELRRALISTRATTDAFSLLLRFLGLGVGVMRRLLGLLLAGVGLIASQTASAIPADRT